MEGVEEFYQKNIHRYRTVEFYRPAHILFRVPKGATPDEAGKSEKVPQGAGKNQVRTEFGEIAILYSEDPSAKDRGELGSFKKGELLPVIEREALRLNVGTWRDCENGSTGSISSNCSLGRKALLLPSKRSGQGSRWTITSIRWRGHLNSS